MNQRFRGVGRVCRLLTVLALLALGSAHAQLRWTSTNPYPTGNTYQAVVHGMGLFVAVADNGVIATSSDGRHWQARESGTDDSLQAVIYANGRFMAAGSAGTIVTSSDGIDWSARASGASFHAGSLAYGNGTYVLGGDSSTFLTSQDGVTWSPHQLDDGCQFGNSSGDDRGRVLFANNRFVAAYASCVLSSADGIEWARLPFGENSWALNFINGTFIAIHDSVLAEVSVDGINWTAQNGPNQYPRWMECTPTLGCYGFYPGDSGVGALHIARSADGTTWETQNASYSLAGNSLYAALRAMTFADGTFVGVGEAGAMIHSNDGVDWMGATQDLPQVLRSATFGAGVYAAVGDGGTVQTTADGEHWTSVAVPTTEDLLGVDYGAGRFVAVGTNGAILASADGAAWSNRESNSLATLHAIAFGGSVYVAVGANGTVLTSPDSVTWQAVDSGTPSTLRALAYGAGRFVAVGDRGLILTSTNGQSWTVASSATLSDALFGVAYGNGEFVALGQSLIPRYSIDGIHWQANPASLSGGGPIQALAFGGSLFMHSNGSFGTVTSSGIVGESDSPANTRLAVRGLAYGSAGWVAVGDAGLHRNSADGQVWSETQTPSPHRYSRLTGVAAGAGSVLAVGIDFAGVSTTPDIVLRATGSTPWSAAPRGEDIFASGVAYHDGRFVAVGASGDAEVIEGATRTVHDVGIGPYLVGVAYAHDRYIALGNGQMIATSSDGLTWQPQTLPSPDQFNGATYGNGIYVVVGSGGIYSSGDAQQWVETLSNMHGYRAAAFGNGTFVATGGAGVAVSPDGNAWTSVCPGNDIESVIFDGSKFIAVGSRVSISFNGQEWRTGFLHSSAGAHGVAYADGRYTAVAEYGGVLQSDNDLIFSTGTEGVVCPLFP